MSTPIRSNRRPPLGRTETAIILALGCMGATHDAVAQGSTPVGTSPGADISTSAPGAPGTPAANAGTAPDVSGQAPAVRTGIETLTVTARKRQEALESVPLSITALPQETLKAAQVQDLRDLSFLTPGLVIKSGGAQYGVTPIIRGQSQINQQGGSDNNVSVFLDGVYLPNNSAIDLNLVGMQRVEVVKGPVSALYGRNAYAGAINYVTERPKDAVTGDIAYTFGNHGRENVAASVSGAIVPGRVRVRLYGSYDSFDGTYHDNISGRNIGGDDRKDVGGSVDLLWNDHITTQINLYYGSDRFSDVPKKYFTPNCANGTIYCGFLNVDKAQGPYSPNTNNGQQSGNTRQVQFVSVRNSFDYDFGTVTATTAYDKVLSQRLSNFDGTEFGLPYPLIPGPGTANLSEFFGSTNNNRDFQQEVRYSTPLDRRLRVSVGGYFYKTQFTNETLIGLDNTNLPPGQTVNATARLFLTPAGVASGAYTRVHDNNQQVSGFVGGEYDIIPGLTFASEYRYTDEHRHETIVANAFLPGVTYPFGPGNSQNFQYFNTRNTLRYFIQPNVMVYGSVANGTKSGGFNQAATVAADRSYGPEKNWTYEIGLKTTFLDNRMQVNLAAFHIDGSNTQISGPSSVPTNLGLVVKNFGGVSTDGFEAEITAVPISGVTLSTGIGYADPTFIKGSNDFTDVASCKLIPSCASRITTVNGRQAVDIHGLSLPFQSNWTFNASANLAYPINDKWSWFSRLDYRLESSQVTTVPNYAFIGTKNILNFNLGVARGPISLTFFIKNILDDHTPQLVENDVELNRFQTVPQAILPDGRTFGGVLRAHF